MREEKVIKNLWSFVNILEMNDGRYAFLDDYTTKNGENCKIIGQKVSHFRNFSISLQQNEGLRYEE